LQIKSIFELFQFNQSNNMVQFAAVKRVSLVKYGIFSKFFLRFVSL